MRQTYIALSLVCFVAVVGCVNKSQVAVQRPGTTNNQVTEGPRKNVQKFLDSLQQLADDITFKETVSPEGEAEFALNDAVIRGNFKEANKIINDEKNRAAFLAASERSKTASKEIRSLELPSGISDADLKMAQSIRDDKAQEMDENAAAWQSLVNKSPLLTAVEQKNEHSQRSRELGERAKKNMADLLKRL